MDVCETSFNWRQWHGPGVEFAGTLADFVRVDLRRKYAELIPFVKVTLLQVLRAGTWGRVG